LGFDALFFDIITSMRRGQDGIAATRPDNPPVFADVCD